MGTLQPPSTGGPLHSGRVAFIFSSFLHFLRGPRFVRLSRRMLVPLSIQRCNDNGMKRDPKIGFGLSGIEFVVVWQILVSGTVRRTATAKHMRSIAEWSCCAFVWIQIAFS